MKELIYDLAYPDYSARQGMNHSTLKNLFPPKTPLDYWWSLHHPRKPSQAMEFGTAVHLAVFEPERFMAEVVECPESDKRTKAGKQAWESFASENAGKTIVSKDEFESAKIIAEAVDNHKTLSNLLRAKDRRFETSGFFEMDGVACKMRMDMILPGHQVILDLKTTRAGHERAFRNSVLDFCYHTQAAFYLSGMSEITGQSWGDFVWIAIESQAPHKIYLYEPDAKWLIEGHRMIAAALELYKKCESEQSYPSASEEIQILEAPTWYD